VSEILLVDAFARRPFEGNQAAVVLLDEPADDAWMQALAGELGYGATCFYRDGELRWFSPTLELTLCGHGTLATSHVLWERGATDEELRFSTVAGELTARRGDGTIQIERAFHPVQDRYELGFLSIQRIQRLVDQQAAIGPLPIASVAGQLADELRLENGGHRRIGTHGRQLSHTSRSGHRYGCAGADWTGPGAA